MDSGLITGGDVLLDGSDEPVRADVQWGGCAITEVGPVESRRGSGSADCVIDATGALVLPGIVDLHGDAFERCLMPRPGVFVDVDAALLDNDLQLLASGITTAFLSATDSWEPGLRSRQTLRQLVAGLARRDRRPEVLLHVRHERCNTSDLDELCGWVGAGDVHLLSFNDHTPGGIVGVAGISEVQVQRSEASRDQLETLLDAAISERDLGMDQEARLARTARRVGCPIASHDRAGTADLEEDLERGVAVTEFPLSLDLALRYLDSGVQILLGAPNLVRGRSHLGHLSAREALPSVETLALCSDYHYPSLLQAPFVAPGNDLCPFGRAWRAVSEVPARAVGLTDRGVIAAGRRADLLVVEPPQEKRPPRVRAVVARGELAWLSSHLTAA